MGQKHNHDVQNESEKQVEKEPPAEGAMWAKSGGRLLLLFSM